MTVSFPMTMPTIGVLKSSFDIERVDFAAPEAGGTLGGVQAGLPRWLMRLSLNNMRPDAFETWRVWLALQRGSIRQFLAFDPDRRVPRAYAAGGGFTTSASAWSQSVDGGTGLATLTLSGLTAGQKLTIGDHVGFAWGGGVKRTIGRACETVVADGSGVAAFAVEPPVPTFVPTVASGCTVSLVNATCLMRLVPGETKLGDVAVGYMEAGGTISAAQDLRA